MTAPSLFTISPLFNPCWNAGLFPPTAPHVARNRYGTFYAVGASTNDPIDFTSTNFVVLWDSGSGSLTTVWSGTLPSNMTALVAFESGELHLVCSNIVSGAIVDLYWQNVTTSLMPVQTSQAPGATALCGKIGAIADDARRCIYIMGSSGYFFRLGSDGSLLSSQQVFHDTVDTTQYSALTLDHDGHLYVALGSDQGGSHDYDVVTAIMTVNPGDATPIWFNGRWIGGSAANQLTLPIDAGENGPGVYLTSGEQYRNQSNFLVDAMVNDGRLYTVVSEWPINTAGFAHDDLRDISLEVVAVNWNDLNALTEVDTEVSRPVRGATIFPRAASGGIVRRGTSIYLLAMDRDNLVALRSTDQGVSWHDYAATPIPDLGTDLPHYMNVFHGQPDAPTIDGVFQIEHCTPSQWATNTCPVPPSLSPSQPVASAYRFSLPAE